MKLRTVLASIASFSSFALLGSFLAPGSTYALWGDQSEASTVTIQPASISATASPGSGTPALLTLTNGQTSQDLGMWWDETTKTWQKSSPTGVLTGGSPGVHPNDHLNYSYVGSQFTWDAAAASALIVEQIRAEPDRSWFGVAGAAKISVTSFGPLSWGVLAQWVPKQTVNKATLWDMSATDMFTVDSVDECVISNQHANALLSAQANPITYTEDFVAGPRFSPDMPESPQDIFVCVVQVYNPLRHTDQAVATAPGTAAGSASGQDITSDPATWSASLYVPDLFDSTAGRSPVLGINITPIDPLNGPAR